MFIPTAGAASPKMAWELNVGSFASAGTVAEVSCGTIVSSVPVVIGRVA